MRAIDPHQRYAIGPLSTFGVVLCQDCGSLVADGWQAAHDNMHAGLAPAVTALTLNGHPVVVPR